MGKTYSIGVMGGDGTGPEVTAEAVKVLGAVSQKCGFKLDYTDYDFGGERYMKTGETLPDSAIEDFKKHDAILLGAIGHPDVAPGILEKGILLKARFALDQYVNLRPIKLYPGVDTPLKDKTADDIDFVVVRENTEDLYSGTGGFTHKGTDMEVAVQSSVYTRKGVERALRFAFEYAQKRNSKKSWSYIKMYLIFFFLKERKEVFLWYLLLSLILLLLFFVIKMFLKILHFFSS